MELQVVNIHGFRRFSKPTELRTNGKLVALLGPNEAGKTSLLKAISTIGNGKPISPGDLSRGIEIADDQVVIGATFALEQSDLQAAGLAEPTWYTIEKTKNGKQFYSFDPTVPARDISARAKVLANLLKVRQNAKLWGRIVEQLSGAIDVFDSTAVILTSTDEVLSDDQIDTLRQLAKDLADLISTSDPKYFSSLCTSIVSMLEKEVEKTPEAMARDAIFTRIPKILFFSNADRLLEGSYDVTELAAPFPPALDNLSKVAKLDLPDLIDAIKEEDTPRITRLKMKANNELKQRFDESWSQSGVHVAFEVNNSQIQVLVQEEDYNFTKLAERSDGLRQFVALQAFTTCERAEDPVLLIDEAEMRLHYDAQADLIQMLSRQKVSSKIIYTTHSAGCLPEDLGNGVRLVEAPSEKSPSSGVKNYFWTRHEGGLEPLLFGMGAATLAFFPIRRALLTEGESDMLLLPTMFREINESESLTFQVVPGVSKTSGINLPILARNGRGVAFALDYDGGGKDLEKKILSAGFEQESIFFIRNRSAPENQIEDFVNPKALAFGANSAFRILGVEGPGVQASQFRTSGRLEAIQKHWKLKKKGDVPKTLIAYKVLEYILRNPSERIIDSSKKSAFKEFSDGVLAYMLKSARPVT